MAEMSEYAPGVPSWVDLGTPDIEKTVAFYEGVFGWQIPESENAEETGGYRVALSNGRSVAGIMPLMQEGQPPVWSTYVNVEDADATVAKAMEAGGTVFAEPMDVMELGRMAVFADPTGAILGIWQPGQMQGAELVNEPVSACWNELNTRDTEAAKAFYSAVFGWDPQLSEVATEGYVSFHNPEHDTEGGVAGMIDMTGRVPDEVPAHWMVYFAVEDTDAAVAKAQELGGSVAVAAIDIPIGRFAVLNDPNGSHFAVIALNE
jgi:uncharacterized protein